MGRKAKKEISPLTMLAIVTLIGFSGYTAKAMVDDMKSSITIVNNNVEKVNDSLTSLTVKVEVLLADRNRNPGGNRSSRVANSSGSVPRPL